MSALKIAIVCKYYIYFGLMFYFPVMGVWIIFDAGPVKFQIYEKLFFLFGMISTYWIVHRAVDSVRLEDKNSYKYGMLLFLGVIITMLSQISFLYQMVVVGEPYIYMKPSV